MSLGTCFTRVECPLRTIDTRALCPLQGYVSPHSEYKFFYYFTTTRVRNNNSNADNTSNKNATMTIKRMYIG